MMNASLWDSKHGLCVGASLLCKTLEWLRMNIQPQSSNPLAESNPARPIGIEIGLREACELGPATRAALVAPAVAESGPLPSRAEPPLGVSISPAAKPSHSSLLGVG